MGNIEIRDQQSAKRRTHIFTDRKSYDAARSGYRKSLTQRYDKSHYSPIRFSKISQIPKDMPLTQRKPNTLPEHYNNQAYSPILNQQSLQNSKSPTHRQLFIKPNKLKNIEIDQNHQQQNQPSQKTGKIVSNSNKRLQQERRSFMPFQEIINQDRPLNSPLQTREIIKKVRNFNDFLNEIKRKLKEDKQQTLLRNKSRLQEFNRNHPSQEKLNLTQHTKISPFKQAIQQSPNTQNLIQKSRSMRKIQVALKLENQKIQLEKYRKLVERQLSKTHSIENISLCTKNSGEKILTIQYETILNQNIFQPDNSNDASLNKQPSEKTLINKILENNTTQQRFQQNFCHQAQELVWAKPIIPQKDHSALIKKLKQQYQKMLQNILDLGKTIERYQMNQSMAQSQVVDDKILIQQPSDFSKKGSQLSQRQFSQKVSNVSRQSDHHRNEQTQLRQKQSQSRVTQTQLRETERQSGVKQSQTSKRSTQHKVAQFDKTQSQCSNKAGSQRSVKGSQKSEKGGQFKSKQDQRKVDKNEVGDESHEYQREKYNFGKEGSRASKARSNSSKKQVQIARKLSEEMRPQLQRNNKNRQGAKTGSQVSNRQSQASNRSSQVSNRSSQVMGPGQQTNETHQQSQQGISFANQSQEQNSFAHTITSNPRPQPKQLHPKDSRQKIQRIESLFDKLNDLQSEYQETDREVREAIGEESYSRGQIEEDSSVN